MLCKNGLHEIDPDDTWRGPGGRRCRECWQAKMKRDNDRSTASGHNAANQRRRRAAGHKSNRDSRIRARSLARKYGLPLSFWEKNGLPYPPDIAEVLSSGDR